MAAEITDITERNREDMESLLSTVAEIAERTRRMETDLHALAKAFSAGGARGLRTLAKSFAARPDPDGSRARFLADGLANLDTWAKERADERATPERPVAGCPHEPACLNAALCLSAREGP